MYLCLALRITYTTAINWTMISFLLLMLLTFRLYLQIILIDRLIDRLGPMDLTLFTLLLELVNLNLNVKKGRMEFWGNLQCCTTPYITHFTFFCGLLFLCVKAKCHILADKLNICRIYLFRLI